MSREGTTGIRAAKGLLELLEENSPEDFQAAKSILGSQQELVDILHLLANYQKRRQESDPKPKTVEHLTEVVRAELVELEIPPRALARITQETIADFRDDEDGRPQALMRIPTTATLEGIAEQALQLIDRYFEAPRDQIRVLIELLFRAGQHAGPEHAEKVADALRALAVEALAGNYVMFSDVKSLGELRLRWSNKPLGPVPKEPRRHFASRLLNDAQMHAPESYREILEKLLIDGLRSPTDTAKTLLRQSKPQQADPTPATAKPTREFAKVVPSAKKIQLLKKAK
jgi:hypothetical protein